MSDLKNPVVVARDGDGFLLAESDVATNPMTDAQTWDPDDGYGPVKPLAVYLKFIGGYLVEVNPPEPWVEPK